MECDEWYNLYLKDYLKTDKVEVSDFGTGLYIIAYLADGSLILIKEGYDFYFYPNAKDFDKDKFLQKDADGNSSRPDAGTKYFVFSFHPAALAPTVQWYKGRGIEPYRSLKGVVDEDGNTIFNTLTREDLLNNSSYGCNQSSPYKTYCTALIQENGWKIPDDYPLKF